MGDDFDLHRAMKSLTKLQQATGAGTFAADAKRRDEVSEKMATLQGYRLAEYKVLVEVKSIRDNMNDIEELEGKATLNAGKKASVTAEIARKKQKVRKSFEALKGLTRDAQREASKEKGTTEAEAKELLYHTENARRMFRNKYSARGGGSDMGDDSSEGGGSLGSNVAGPYRGGYGATSPTVNNIQDFSDVGSGGGVNLREDDEFRQFFQSVEQRNVQFDAALDRIHAGVLRLGDMAQGLKTELDLQSQLLDTTEAKTDAVAGKLKGLNRQLKKTIKAVDSDKMCMYLICFIVLLGLGGGILYASGALK
jgi:hypothetical protein